MWRWRTTGRPRVVSHRRRKQQTTDGRAAFQHDIYQRETGKRHAGRLTVYVSGVRALTGAWRMSVHAGHACMHPRRWRGHVFSCSELEHA